MKLKAISMRKIKFDKPLVKLIRKKDKLPILLWERRGITTASTFINMIRKYYIQIYTSKFDKVGEMDKFLERHKLQKHMYAHSLSRSHR